ncbi:MAG: HAMP domain-containing protein [Syntrophaceae bacterium]|nr:HAMP domain-containing protein [Syntrophaceae bacterium]
MNKFRNSLFIKICLSFWVTTVIMVGAVLAVDWMTGSGPFRKDHPPMPVPPLAVHAQALAWIHEREGLKALREFAGRLREIPGAPVRFLDGRGRDLLKGLETTGSESAAAPGRIDGRDTPVAAGGERRESFTLRGSDGRTYTLESTMPGRPHRPNGPLSRSEIAVRLLVVLLVSGFICYLLARYLTVPILKIGVAAREFAAGNLEVRVAPALGKRSDETSRLARDFDLMAERIASLLNAQRTLLRDISHELRSPLARLNLALELCREKADREADKWLDRIELEAGRLNEMIGHILTLNQAETGITEADRADVDMVEMVREIAEDAAFEAEGIRRGLKITALEPCFVNGHRNLLRRAIDNVVRNAVRYSREGTDVEISLRCTEIPSGTEAVIVIRDHGKGVPEEAIPNLFRPFYRVGEGRERESGGTGLGLAITEKAVRLHGGTVRAANAPGGGLLVEISLPAGNGAADPGRSTS